MAKIKKGNRILNVDNSRLESYLKQGYDQINDTGKVIKLATGGKTVTIGEYNRALEENTALKLEVEKFKTELAKLKKEAKKGDKKDTKEEAK